MKKLTSRRRTSTTTATTCERRSIENRSCLVKCVDCSFFRSVEQVNTSFLNFIIIPMQQCSTPRFVEVKQKLEGYSHFR